MIVYLCGGINGLNDTLARSWREYAKSRLPETRDPMDRDYRGLETLHVDEIVHGDLKDIDESDVLLAMCRTPSWGTAMEIFYAATAGKKVYSVIGLNPPGVSPWLAYHSRGGIFATLGEAIDAILEGR